MARLRGSIPRNKSSSKRKADAVRRPLEALSHGARSRVGRRAVAAPPVEDMADHNEPAGKDDAKLTQPSDDELAQGTKPSLPFELNILPPMVNPPTSKGSPATDAAAAVEAEKGEDTETKVATAPSGNDGDKKVSVDEDVIVTPVRMQPPVVDSSSDEEAGGTETAEASAASDSDVTASASEEEAAVDVSEPDGENTSDADTSTEENQPATPVPTNAIAEPSSNSPATTGMEDGSAVAEEGSTKQQPEEADTAEAGVDTEMVEPEEPEAAEADPEKADPENVKPEEAKTEEAETEVAETEKPELDEAEDLSTDPPTPGPSPADTHSTVINDVPTDDTGKKVKPVDERNHDTEDLQKPTPEPMPELVADVKSPTGGTTVATDTTRAVSCSHTDGLVAKISCETAQAIQSHVIPFSIVFVLLCLVLLRTCVRLCRKPRDDRGEYRAVAEQYGELLYDNTFDENYSYADGQSLGSGGMLSDDEDDWSGGAKIELSGMKHEQNGGLTLEEMNG